MGPDAIAVLSGCRQDAQGAWFFPTGPDDPRLPAPVLTAEEEQQTAGLRAEIETQLAGLAATMPYWMPEELDRLYEPDKQPVSGHRDLDRSFGVLRPQYEEILIAYLRDPSRIALANYANWWFNRREAAVPAATCSSMPPPICDTMRNRLGYVGIGPWPWDPEDPLTLAEYLKWVLANGRIVLQPPPIPTPLPSSPDGIDSGPLYPLLVHVVDAAGAPLDGACVEVVLPLGTDTICDNDQLDHSPTAGVIEVRGSPWTYTVREIRPPEGHALTGGVRTVELTSAGAAVVLVHGPGSRGADGPSSTPTSSTLATSRTTGIEGQTYTSPQFGYIVTWQSPWEPDVVASDPQAGDNLRLVTGEVALEYHGFSTDQPIEQALEDLVAARARNHSGSTPQYQAAGGGPNSDSPALWHFTYTRADGVVMGEASTAFSVEPGGAVLIRTSIRPIDDASPRSLYYAVSLFLDSIEATAAAQQATEQGNVVTLRPDNVQNLADTLRTIPSLVEVSDTGRPTT